jgi:PAS domain S-box-containing protein
MNNKKKDSITNKYESILEYHPTSMIICDKKGKIISLNKNAIRHFSKINKFGKNKENYIGVNFFKLLNNEVDFKQKEIINKLTVKKEIVYLNNYYDGNNFLYQILPILDLRTEISNILIYIINTNIENNIEDSSDKYRLLVEQSPDVLLQTTKIGIITYMSSNVKSIYGYNLEDVIGRHFKNFVPSSQMPRLLLKMKEMISGKTINGFRTIVKHKDGHLIPIELSGKFITHKNRSYFNAIMRNISEKVETEEALKQSELQRKFILETIPDLLFIINKHGYFISYHGNRNALYQPPELFLNKKVISVLPDPLGKKTMKYVKKAIVTNKIQIFNYDLKIKNRIHWYEARMVAINKINVICIVRDITSLKEQQDQLIKNKDFLQRIINSASEIILTIDINKKIIIWNDSAKKITGYNRRDIINKNLKKIRLIDNFEEFKSYINKLFDIKKSSSFKFVINTKYKTKRIWNASPSLIFNESNEISEIFFICDDITFEEKSYTKVLFGRSYIFFDKTNDKAFKLFCNIFDKKNNIYIITRDLTEKINGFCNKRNVELIYLSPQNEIINSVKDPSSLFNLIEKKIKKKSIIFMDRLDYFLNLYPYQELAENLYKINDLVQKSKSLAIIRLNPDSLSTEKIIALKEEFTEYISRGIDEITIDKDLYEILEFINSRNQKNIIVTYKEIGIKFTISKITVSKKIDQLINLNLVKSYKSGRTKILELTDEGRTIINTKS